MIEPQPGDVGRRVRYWSRHRVERLEAAVKIANEIRVKMIADGSWQPKA